MIKIIKQGKPNRKIKMIFERECLMCGCIFEFEKEDLKTYVPFGDKTIKCPCCNLTLGIELEDTKYRIVEIEEDEYE